MPAPSPFGAFLEPLEKLGRIDVQGTGAWLAPPEYVILRKLQFYREGGSDKHLRDIRFILAQTPIDRELVETEVARRGLQETWRAVKQ